jgi:hypothetical protein
MAELLRRTDLADRPTLNRAVKRAATQAIRDAGDGSGLGGAPSTAAWGSITGTLSAQTDLNQVLKDKETFDFFLDN